MDFVLKIIIELTVLWGLAILYFFYQKRKIPHYIFEERNQIIEILLQLAEKALVEEDLDVKQKNLVLKLSDHLQNQKGLGHLGITAQFHFELMQSLNQDGELYNYLISLKAEIDEEK
jgi:hypothetical protein